MNIEPRIFNEPRLRAMMERRGIDLLLLRGTVNSKYLSGFFHNGGDHDGTVGDRPFVVFYFLDPAKEAVMVVPGVDLHLAMTCSWIKDVRAYATAERYTDLDVPLYRDFFDAARAIFAERGVKGMAIGTEGDQLSAAFAKKLNAFLEGNTIVDVSHDMGLVRMVKTDEEIRRIRNATRWTTAAHESFRGAIEPGVSDWDLYRVAAKRMIDEGSEAPKFIFVGTGPTRFAANACFPTGHALKEGEFVRVDMGASCLGYSADFVRCYFLGHCTQRQQDVWKWLNEVEMEIGTSIRPGETGGEIYQRGVKAIEKYLDRFPREFIGHGIGLVSNEEPRMHQGNEVEMEPGVVYCTEFSYYLEGGVRLHTEDMYLITERGSEMLTEDCPRDLVVPV
jgi:Xaa-Pro aminopeptidase